MSVSVSDSDGVSVSNGVSVSDGVSDGSASAPDGHVICARPLRGRQYTKTAPASVALSSAWFPPTPVVFEGRAGVRSAEGDLDRARLNTTSIDDRALENGSSQK